MIVILQTRRTIATERGKKARNFEICVESKKVREKFNPSGKVLMTSYLVMWREFSSLCLLLNMSTFFFSFYYFLTDADSTIFS